MSNEAASEVSNNDYNVIWKFIEASKLHKYLAKECPSNISYGKLYYTLLTVSP